MRAGRGVAQQGEVLVRPALAEHAREIDPGRAAQVAGIGYQPMAAEMPGEDLLAGRNRLLAVHVAEAPRRPSLLAAFDDEGRGLGLELVGVRPHPAVLGLLEDEGEGVVELLPGAEPDELAFAH